MMFKILSSLNLSSKKIINRTFSRHYTKQIDKIVPSYFQYGCSSWETIMTEKSFVVDNTDNIRNLENAGNYLKLWRPRRFGKSLLCEQLALYYDVLVCGSNQVICIILR